MSATDEFRKMLDERGIEHYVAEDESWVYVCEDIPDMYSCNIRERPDGLLNVHIHGCTPAKAVEVMLGRGEYQECHATKQNYKRCKYSTNRGWCDDECELHDCEGSFSAVNKPVWRCDCGAFMTQYTDATTYHKPRYCPNCGRKVKQ